VERRPRRIRRDRGLGRETNVLGGLAQPWPRTWRSWLRLAGVAVIVVLPYRSTIFAGADAQTSLRGVEFGRALVHTASQLWPPRLASSTVMAACILGSISVQALFVVVSIRRRDRPWWRVGIGYVFLLLILDRVLVAPSTGAITRVILPLTVAFNALLMLEPRPSRFWPWLVLGNLHVIPALKVL